jgi:Uma2 family endonuclease
LVDLSDHSRIVTNSEEQFAYEMKLKPEFKWFQSQEFKQLWRQKPVYPDVPVQIREPAPREIENFEIQQEPRPAENKGHRVSAILLYFFMYFCSNQ